MTVRTSLEREGKSSRKGMRREVGERFKREGTYVYLQLIHADVWQEPSKHCKVTIQLK